MRHFYLSAKTGDNVSTCFYKVASELSGVTLTKPEVKPLSFSCIQFVSLFGRHLRPVIHLADYTISLSISPSLINSPLGQSSRVIDSG